MKYVAAIDSGTSSTRFVVFDSKGQVIDSEQEECKLIHPKAGWTESDPMDILDGALNTMKRVMGRGKVKASEICAIGLTNQRESVIAWDSVTGKPLYNAIIWLDLRTEGVVTTLKRKLGSAGWLREKTGLPISTYFSAVKLRWMFENVPAVVNAAKQKTLMVGTVDAWVMWNLTGNHITDVTNASRTMLMDLKTCQWDEKCCDFFDLPMDALPEIVPSSESFGKCIQGPLIGVPLTCILGDQQAAMLGQLCIRKGLAKNTYGTGCFMLMNTGDEAVISKKGLLTTVLWQLGKRAKVQYALEGSIAVAGLSLKWVVENLGLAHSAVGCVELAETVKDSGGVFFVPAFTGLFAPHWKPSARGTIWGMTLSTTKAHIVRALLEAICNQTVEVLEAMRIDAGMKLEELRVDGGMTKSDLMMQLQSDILQVPVARPDMAETTVLGAAIGAGLAVGYWKSLEEAEKSIIGARVLTYFKPKIAYGEAAKKLASWKAIIPKSFAPASQEDDLQFLD